MRIAGVIAEYNPFHSGHQYHLSQLRAAGADRIVAVMSGNYVQRGDVAVMDKFRRARAAVRYGADLVIELPTVFSLAPAERFAYGGVSLLAALGCMDMLSFGCEDNDPAALSRLADGLDDPRIETRIAQGVRSGISHPAARESAVRTLLGGEDADRLRRPNNILAVEYIRACRKLGADWDLVPIRRIGVLHDSDNQSENGYMSASAIRSFLYAGKFPPSGALPNATVEALENGVADGSLPAQLSRLERPLLYALRRADLSALAELPDISEGLEAKIHRAAREATNLEELLAGIKSKRYPLARIRRLLLYAFLGFTREDFLPTPPYIRVLAANGKGFDVLRIARDTAHLPIVTKAGDIRRLGAEAERFFHLESRCDDLYGLAAPKIRTGGTNCTTGVQIVKS